jgi:hypothetical protein
MRITHKRTVDRELLGAAQKKLDAARATAAAEMKTLKEQRKAVGAKKGQGRVGGWHVDAVMNAIASEGPEVMTAAAKGYWDDMKRLYPEMCADEAVPGTDSLNGARNKYGRVKEKWIKGKWYHWDTERGDWVPGEITKRKGIN